MSSYNQQNKAVSFKQKLFAGSLAGICGTSVVYPLDIIKTNLQTTRLPGSSSVIAATKNIALSIFRERGFTGFYKGFGACLVGIAPEKALKLAVNDSVKDYIQSLYKVPVKKFQVHEEIVAGSIAGFVQLIVTVPYEMVKIRLQMSKTTMTTGFQIVRELGPMGLYKGFTATFFRDVPFCFLFFVSLE